MDMQHRSTIRLCIAATLVLVAGGLAGCLQADAATGSTALYVKDAPADRLAHLYVTFNQVQVHQLPNRTAERTEAERESEREAPDHGNVTGGTPPGTGRVSVAVEVDEENGSEHDEGRWLTVEQGNVTVDLKALNGTASAFLGGADVPVGSYNQIRLTVVAATAVWTNGTEQPVKVPGHALRINGRFTVQQGKETKLTLDFDLARSLVQRGDGALLLKPVLHMESEHRERPGADERREREREAQEERAESRRRGHGDRD